MYIGDERTYLYDKKTPANFSTGENLKTMKRKLPI